MNTDPGLFFPKVAMGVRDEQIFALYGEYKHAGNVEGPLFPSNGIPLLAAAIGQDAAVGYGVTGSGATNTTTLSSPAAVNDTTISVTSASGYSVGSIVQVGTNSTTNSTTTECRKVTGVASNVLTIDSPLTYGHSSGASVAVVVAPFTHSLTPVNIPSSLTIERVYGNGQSLQFAGCRPNRLDLKLSAGNDAASMTADMLASRAVVIEPSTAISVVNELPFVFAEATLDLFGTQLVQAKSIELTIDNGVKPTYTFNNSHEAEFITAMARKITAKVDLVFTSLDDPTWGYYTLMRNAEQGALSLTLAHAGGNASITINLPLVSIGPQNDDFKFDDVIVTSLPLEAAYSLSSSQSINATVINSNYLPE